jgi:hypothetical protein
MTYKEELKRLVSANATYAEMKIVAENYGKTSRQVYNDMVALEANPLDSETGGFNSYK